MVDAVIGAMGVIFADQIQVCNAIIVFCVCLFCVCANHVLIIQLSLCGGGGEGVCYL